MQEVIAVSYADEYNKNMSKFDNFIAAMKDANRSEGLRAAIAIQKIEGNPLTEDEIAMFDDFEARGLSNDECLAEIKRVNWEQYGVRQVR